MVGLVVSVTVPELSVIVSVDVVETCPVLSVARAAKVLLPAFNAATELQVVVPVAVCQVPPLTCTSTRETPWSSVARSISRIAPLAAGAFEALSTMPAERSPKRRTAGPARKRSALLSES